MLGSFVPVVVRIQAASAASCAVGAATGVGTEPLEQPASNTGAISTATIANSLRMPTPLPVRTVASRRG